MYGSMVDIKSATTENRRGKKEEGEETTAVKYNVHICYADRKTAIITVFFIAIDKPRN